MPPTNEQLALRAILARRNGRLERIYAGFLSVYYQEDNPDRLTLAAHPVVCGTVEEKVGPLEARVV